MRKIFSILVLVVFMLSMGLAQLGNSAWPMRGHDLQRTGLSPFVGPENPTLKWLKYLPHRFDSSPVIGTNGWVTAGCELKYIHSFLPGDGTHKWLFYTNGSIQVKSGPAVSTDGTIYFGANKFYAINPTLGTSKWVFNPGAPVNSSPAITADGTIIFGCENNNVYALKPDSKLKWSFKTGGGVSSSPAISSDDNTIYIGSNDKNLYALNSNDGTKKWEFTTGDQVKSIPAVGSDGTIYFGSYDKNVYAINPDGTKKWAFTTGGGVESSPAIGSDGTIYIGSNDKNVYAINPDGTKKWVYTTNGVIINNPAIDSKGTIYVSGDDANIYAINPDGTKKWIFKTVAKTYSSPAIGADGTVYVGNIAIGTSLSSITVTSPNTNVQWIQGNTYTITWKSTDVPGSVKIELYKGDVFNSTITSSVSNIGSYKWKIPANQVVGNDYKVKISTVVLSTVTDVSDTNFSIIAPKPNSIITVAIPNGGEQWQQGKTYPVTWTSSKVNGNVKIELFKNGVFNSIINNNIENIGVFNWNVPITQTVGTDYRIRISSISDSTIVDDSDADFAITSLPIINVPQQISPTNNSINLLSPISIVWLPVNYALNYEYEIYDNTDSLIETNITTSMSTVIESELNAGNQYRWRVRAIGEYNNYSAYSPKWLFTMNKQLHPPTLISPADNAIDIPINTTFIWTSVLNSLAYDVEISKDANFTNKISLGSPTTTLTTLLAYSTKYYWRARGKNGNNLGLWSTVFTFTTTDFIPISGVDSAIRNSKNGSPTFGFGIINNTGNMQTVIIDQEINRQSEFDIMIKNTGNVPDIFLITSNTIIDKGINSKWKVAIFDDSGTDLTSKVFNNGWTSYNVKPGQSVILRLRLAASSKQIIDENNPPKQSVGIIAQSMNDIKNGITTPASDTVIGVAFLIKRSNLN